MSGPYTTDQIVGMFAVTEADEKMLREFARAVYDAGHLAGFDDGVEKATLVREVKHHDPTTHRQCENHYPISAEFSCCWDCCVGCQAGCPEPE